VRKIARYGTPLPDPNTDRARYFGLNFSEENGTFYAIRTVPFPPLHIRPVGGGRPTLFVTGS